jgi:hypothetical protein
MVAMQITIRQYSWLTISLLTVSLVGVSAADRPQQDANCCGLGTSSGSGTSGGPGGSAQAASGQANGPGASHGTALTPDQIRELVAHVLENQRRSALSLTEYERTQRNTVRGDGKDIPEKRVTVRVVPIGMAEARVEFERNGKPADHADIERQWRSVEKALAAQAHSESSFFSRQEYERVAKQKREKADMIAEMGRAFRFTWSGRQMVAGKPVVELAFEPDPAYRSSSRYAPLYAHSHGSVWIAESSAQLIRLVAELTDEVFFGGGLIAKVYRGSRFTFEQSEIAPGVWLPVKHTYDFDGRKFLFALNIHEQTEFSDYRRIGDPQEALLLIRGEHAPSGSTR